MTAPETYKGVPVPRALGPNWKTTEALFWISGVGSALAVVGPVLDALVGGEDGPCLFDHHGYCQEHGGGQTGGRCATAVARELLEAFGPGQVWRSTVLHDLYWCWDHRPAVAVTPVSVADLDPDVAAQCVQCGRRLSRG